MANKVKVYDFLVQFIKFGIVGASNTLIYLAIYYVLVFLNIHYIFAYTVGFVVSVLNAYYWNSKYVFKKSTDNYGRILIRTFVSYGSVFLLSTFLLFIMVSYVKVSELIAPIINLIITVPLNFLLNKFWAFK